MKLETRPRRNKPAIRKYFTGLTKNSVLLAFASLFSDISTEMLYPILPVYLSQYLKASGSIIGIIEGVAQAAQNVIQGLSGWLSDKFQKRKPIALFGYMLSAVSKPLMGVFNSWPGVMGARIMDRLGAGSRAAPRDALIAGSVDEQYKGKAFGLEGIGDNMGAFLGPLLTILLFFTLHVGIRSIFYLALIPGLLSAAMILMVKERKDNQSVKSKLDLRLRNFPKKYWSYLLIIALFGLGNVSNSFLILQIKGNGLSLIHTILVYAFYNLVAALISYPAGALSDRYGRKPLLGISFVIFMITYAGFAFTANLVIAGFLFIFYGLFQGIFRSVGKTFAADFVPQHLRASSIGWYSTVVGISGLIASVVAGLLWDQVSHAAVFLYGAFFSLVATVGLVFFKSE
jgi:MFS family permease